MVTVGVLALQGDYLEHAHVLSSIGARVVPVNGSKSLEEVDALVLPGGESTTLCYLLKRLRLREDLVKAVREGLPVLGTCAGMVLLAKEVRDAPNKQPQPGCLGLIDALVLRNAFGRQRESFEARVRVKGLGDVRGVFIRAPVVERIWGSAEELASINHPALGKAIVAVREGNVLALSFHPELVGEAGLYRALLGEAGATK